VAANRWHSHPSVAAAGPFYVIVKTEPQLPDKLSLITHTVLVFVANDKLLQLKIISIIMQMSWQSPALRTPLLL